MQVTPSHIFNMYNQTKFGCNSRFTEERKHDEASVRRSRLDPHKTDTVADSSFSSSFWNHVVVV
eukprot:scaffold1410_cov154-Amphora_coffeaeformis.AAC.10